MLEMPHSNVNIKTVPGASLSSQPWWPQLHRMIIESFLYKNYSVFPPTWTRLNEDVQKGAEGLAKELGDDGYLAILFSNEGKPVACGGVLPHTGDNWIDEVNVKSDEQLANASKIADDTNPSANRGAIAAWEISCFCVHPTARGQGLAHQLLDALIEFIKPKGGKRLFTHYAIDETGEFWKKLAFDTVPDASDMLPKGFKVDPNKEGLRADIHFRRKDVVIPTHWASFHRYLRHM